MSINVLIAAIGVTIALMGSFFTAQTIAAGKVNTVETKVEVLEERQELQYKELTKGIERIESQLSEIIKTIK